MSAVDNTRGRCLVFTFKEGLLSTVAHDLQLEVGRWSLDLDDTARTLRGTFDPRSLRVVCVMRDGREERALPSDRDRRTIEEHIIDDVLEPKRHPQIAFSGTWSGDGDERAITGTLELHGTQRPINTTAKRSDGKWRVTLELDQTAYRIKPFSAMLGTLKVKPSVRIELTVPA